MQVQVNLNCVLKHLTCLLSGNFKQNNCIPSCQSTKENKYYLVYNQSRVVPTQNECSYTLLGCLTKNSDLNFRNLNGTI